MTGNTADQCECDSPVVASVRAGKSARIIAIAHTAVAALLLLAGDPPAAILLALIGIMFILTAKPVFLCSACGTTRPVSSATREGNPKHASRKLRKWSTKAVRRVL